MDVFLEHCSESLAVDWCKVVSLCNDLGLAGWILTTDISGIFLVYLCSALSLYMMVPFCLELMHIKSSSFTYQNVTMQLYLV